MTRPIAPSPNTAHIIEQRKLRRIALESMRPPSPLARFAAWLRRPLR